MGIATQSGFMTPDINSCDSVFEFCDTFDGDALDTSKWVTAHTNGQHDVSVAGGQLDITANYTSGDYGFIQMRASTPVGTDTLLIARARHATSGLQCEPNEDTDNAAEVGLKDANFSWSNVIRIMDYPFTPYYTVHSTLSGNSSGYIETEFSLSDSWVEYSIFRNDSGTVAFDVNASGTPFSLTNSPYVPSSDLYPWLMSYAEECADSSTFEVDWIRVRKYYDGAESSVLHGNQQAQPIADAGPGQTVEIDQGGCLANVTLDGSGSDDSDGDPLSYNWLWDSNSTTGENPTIQLPPGTHTITLVLNGGTVDSIPDTTETTVEDTTAPDVAVSTPIGGIAYQGVANFRAMVSDFCDVDDVDFFIFASGGALPVYSDLLPTYIDSTGEWEISINTATLPDGFYEIEVKATDSSGNEGSSGRVSFAIANWAFVELLPSSDVFRAGRTVPIKFGLFIAGTQTFVHNEDLKIRICHDVDDCESSTWGDTSRDYRIDDVAAHYITNYKTANNPIYTR